MGRYVEATDVIAQLGRTLSEPQTEYLSERIIPAAEEWVDSTGGRVYGLAPVTGEPLTFYGNAYTWLSKAPIDAVDEVRGWYWGQGSSSVRVLADYEYTVVRSDIGYLYVPNWRNFAHLEVDYTPESAVPERIKLATAIVCCVYMRTVLHPETEWLTEYSSGQDIRLKFAKHEIPQHVLDMIGSAGDSYVVA